MMFKIGLLSSLGFISSSVFAQSKLVIDSMYLPVEVVEQTIKLQPGKHKTLKVPDGKNDTIVMFNPETFGELIEIISKGPDRKHMRIKEIGLKVKRDEFLQFPLLYLSHNGRDYSPYRCYVYFFQKDRFIGLAFDNTEVAGPNYSLRYMKTTMLVDFQEMLEKNLSPEVSEIYIGGAAFISPETGEKLFLSEVFKVRWKE
jgi:hypothetical protein